MAYAMTKQGSLDNCVTYEFICDAITDMNAIENRYRTIGSVAVVLQGESDGLEVYIAGSDKQWNNLGSMGAASNSQGGSSGLSIYICAQNEVSNGLPNISEPDESTIYLVPAGNTSGNLYEEYIYANDAWEKFGGGGSSIDLSNYITKTDYATTSDAGVVKVNGYGVQMINNGTQLAIDFATEQEIEGGARNYEPITPANQHLSTFYGLGKAANLGTLTYNDTTKGDIRTMIGAGTYTKPNDGIPAADLANTYLVGAQALELGNLLTNTGTDVTNAILSQDYTTNFESLKDKQITLLINEDEYPITLTKSTDERPYGPYTIYVTIFTSNEKNNENLPMFKYEHNVYNGDNSNTTDICTICLDTEYNNPIVKLQYKGDIKFNYPQMYINCNDNGTGGQAVITDVSHLAPKASPEFTGSISMGRKSPSTIATNSIALGTDTEATAPNAYAQGNSTKAYGVAAHAEGYQTIATSQGAHAEGCSSNGTQISYTVYAESYDSTDSFHGRNTSSTITSMPGAHANGSHAEGYNTIAAGGGYQHAEGYQTLATGGSAQHAEGYQTYASGQSGSHAEGYQTYASGQYGSHAEGYQTYASDTGSHAEGRYTIATGFTSHAEGNLTTVISSYGHAEGDSTFALGVSAHAEGQETQAIGTGAHAEGYQSQAIASFSHAEGYKTSTNGSDSHAEGTSTIAQGQSTHAEGTYTVARGAFSHAEGAHNEAMGQGSHVGGKYIIKDSYNNWPEWEANKSYIIGDRVKRTTVSNNQTTVKGYICSTANNDASFTSSKWNLDQQYNYVEIIGNGKTENARSNARALDWEGNEHLMGDLYVHCNNDSTGGTKVATEATVAALTARVVELETQISSLMQALNNLIPAVQITDESGNTITDENGDVIVSDTAE